MARLAHILLLPTVAQLQLLTTVHAQQENECGFDRLMQAGSILATCCESTNSSDCGNGFPPTCTIQCAKLMVPFYNSCSKTLKSMPKGHFQFSIRAMKSYTQNCEHTQELFHYSRDSCADTAKEKEQRIMDVTRACCSQKGKFVCAAGTPWTCNVSTSQHATKSL